MAPQVTTTPDLKGREDLLLRRLLGLYQEEIQVYGQILQLSRQQGHMIQQGLPLAEIRKILDQKKKCLDLISRLEATERQAKQAWDNGRHQWSARGRSQLHQMLGRVGELIEQILICEEENDLHLIQQTGAV
jgi:DNA-binding transcriptional MerR regulator